MQLRTTADGASPSHQTPTSLHEEIDALPVHGGAPSPYTGKMVLDLWHTCKFYLGLLTTVLVILAWTTNLVAKPMATIFGGSVTLLGMGIAYFNYSRNKQQGYIPVPITNIAEHLPGSMLAVLLADDPHNEAVIHAAIDNAHGQPVDLFCILVRRKPVRLRAFLNIMIPITTINKPEALLAKLSTWHKRRRSPAATYTTQKPDVIAHIWQVIHPSDLIISSENASLFEEINPDRIRYEVTPDGRIAHLLKSRGKSRQLQEDRHLVQRLSSPHLKQAFPHGCVWLEC